MEETFDRADEQAGSAAVIAGAGAVLVGVGIALVYLLGRGRKPGAGGGGGRTPTVKLTIDDDGAVTVTPWRIEVPVDPDHPNRPYFVDWLVTNTGRLRILAFENFRRENEGPISALDPSPANRIPQAIPGNAFNHLVRARISRDAVVEFLASGERDHEYEYDVWIDRARRLDPEIAIIRGGR